MPLTRRRLLQAGTGLALTLGPASQLHAIERRYFRIASGTTGGVYYPLARLIAAAISNPAGVANCQVGALCGIPGLIAVAQTSTGSLDNLQQLAEGDVDSAFCQADVAARAFTIGLAETDQAPFTGLRVLSHLYDEVLQVVVRLGAGIRSIADLAGRRISLGPVGSGSRADAEHLLALAGLSGDAVERFNLPPVQAAAALREGELDGFFTTSGVPANAISSLADEGLIDLLPIEGSLAEALMASRSGLRMTDIVPGTYHRVELTPSLATAALWVTTEGLPEDLAFALTQTLWDPASLAFYASSGLATARDLEPARALDGIGTPPLHKGAGAFYRQQGLLE
ncbi:MAG: TAXI family TRAP transporter solute-binding subunit [Pseudomonadota bacterium]